MDSTSIVELNSEHIGELHNGAFGVRIDKCLQQLVKDIIDRPVNGAGKPETRKLKIQLELVPEASLENGVYELQAINVEGTVSGSVPTYRTMKTDVRVQNGKIKFNKDCPARFEQRTLDEYEPEEEQE